jgi:crotonobetainyl-CoA:carnitine CoA-transferase CaiB-like acyl-CoA transferase
VEALAGTLSITRGSDDRPAIPGIPIADIVSSLQGLSGILMALLRRERTGRGEFLDISMHDSIVAAAPNVLGPTFSEGKQPVPTHERSLGGSALYRIYETSDARHLVLGGQEMKFARNLLSALGRLDFLDLCERGPGPHQKPLIDFLSGVFRLRSLAEWVVWFEPRDICFAPVNTLTEALEDEQVLARGTILTDELGRRHLAPAIRFRNEPGNPQLREPELGEHNMELLGVSA